MVDADADVSGESLQLRLDAAHLNDPHYHSPAPRTIRDILKRNNFTFKIMTNRVERYNTDATKHARFRYVHDIALPLFTPQNTVFIDESGFSSQHHRSKGWSRKGTPAFHHTKTVRGVNHSVIAAISPVHGLVHYKLKRTEKNEEYKTEGVGEEVFVEFTRQLLSKNIFKQRSTFYFVIMDNVGFHRSPDVVKLYNARHHHVLLPPYSPFLNPIELIFSQWKQLYKKEMHRDDEEVVAAIHSSAQKLQVNLPLFLACYNHTCSFYDRVLRMETIDD